MIVDDRSVNKNIIQVEQTVYLYYYSDISSPDISSPAELFCQLSFSEPSMVTTDS